MGFFSKLFGGGKQGYELDPMYEGLRGQVFDVAKSGLDGVSPADQVLAVVMDTGFPENCFTLVAVADGTASLYFSNGGGMIGSGAYPRIANAATALVVDSAQYLEQMELSEERSLPTPGQVVLSVVTKNGVRRSVDEEDNLGHGRAALAPLFHQVHGLIGMMRQVEGLRENESPLVLAVAMGQVDELKKALADGGDPNSKSSLGQPLAGVAVMSGAPESLRVLIESGVDVEQMFEVRPNEHAPFVCAAAAADESECLKALLDGGADIEKADPTGLTALHISSFLGHEASMSVLLERGANIEAKEETGYTPLMMAANSEQWRAVGVLLSRGASVNAKDNDGSTALMFAAQHGNLAIVEQLLEAGADVTVKGNHGLGALEFAKQNGHADVAAILGSTT